LESFKFAILTEHDRNPHHTPQYVLDRILPLALYPLLFVCRSFNYEVSRLLYSAVRVQFVAESNSKAWDTGPNWNLLQTLGSSPHLTKHVHHFCIRFLDPEYTEDPVLPLTDLNDHLRDQNITEVQSLIQKAMGNMSPFTCPILYANHPFSSSVPTSIMVMKPIHTSGTLSLPTLRLPHSSIATSRYSPNPEFRNPLTSFPTLCH